MKYAILLRGVNAGGKRRVEMARFRAVLEKVGMKNVQTYINSGNAVGDFDGSLERQVVQMALEAEFGFDISTLVLRGEDIVRIAEAIPKSWVNDYTDNKSDVAYLFPEADTPEVKDRLGENPEVETILYVPGALLSNVSRQNQPKSSLKKVIGTKLYYQMTVRNVTTARRLAEMVRYTNKSEHKA